MTFLLIVGGVCLAFGVAFGIWDRHIDPDDDEFVQSKHCTVTDKEPTRT